MLLVEQMDIQIAMGGETGKIMDQMQLTVKKILLGKVIPNLC